MTAKELAEKAYEAGQMRIQSFEAFWDEVRWELSRLRKGLNEKQTMNAAYCPGCGQFPDDCECPPASPAPEATPPHRMSLRDVFEAGVAWSLANPHANMVPDQVFEDFMKKLRT